MDLYKLTFLQNKSCPVSNMEFCLDSLGGRRAGEGMQGSGVATAAKVERVSESRCDACRVTSTSTPSAGAFYAPPCIHHASMPSPPDL
jgi:hypothetical protein